jgi:hypothetical protein
MLLPAHPGAFVVVVDKIIHRPPLAARSSN